MTENELIKQYAETYAKCLVYYGVDVRERFETATQISLSLENAYIKGRHDEYKRLEEPIEELKTYRAIGTLEEIKQNKIIADKRYDYLMDDIELLKTYTSIGTLEECRTAMERMKPRKATDMFTRNDGIIIYHCPVCQAYVIYEHELQHDRYCANCGQAIDFV